jgi:hypothetical protein
VRSYANRDATAVIGLLDEWTQYYSELWQEKNIGKTRKQTWESYISLYEDGIIQFREFATDTLPQVLQAWDSHNQNKIMDFRPMNMTPGFNFSYEVARSADGSKYILDVATPSGDKYGPFVKIQSFAINLASSSPILTYNFNYTGCQKLLLKSNDKVFVIACQNSNKILILNRFTAGVNN